MKLLLCFVCLVAAASTYFRGEIKMKRLSVVTTNWAEKFDVSTQLDEFNSIGSPLSVYTALYNLYLGASGDTKTEISDVLEQPRFTGGAPKPHEALSNLYEEYKKLNTSVSRVLNANYIAVPNNILITDKFLSNIALYYPDTVIAFHNQTDPSTTEKKINDFFLNKTDGYIKDIVKPGSVHSETCLVLVDAMFVFMIWDFPFLKVDTEQADFTINSTAKIKVEMMYDDFRRMKAKKNFFNSDVGEVTGFGGRLSFYVILPHVGNTIANLEKKLAEGNNSKELFKNLTEGAVKFCLPKFSFESTYELSLALKGMGMVKAFDKTQADFRAFSKTSGVCVSKHIHKAVISVNENGTAIVPGAPDVERRGTQIATICLNRPFLFFLVDNNRNIILTQGQFWGRNPS